MTWRKYNDTLLATSIIKIALEVYAVQEPIAASIFPQVSVTETISIGNVL